jgi:hypothetical protein
MVLTGTVGEFGLEKKIGAGDHTGAIACGQSLTDAGLKIVAALIGGVDGAESREDGELDEASGALFFPGGAVKKVKFGIAGGWEGTELFCHEAVNGAFCHHHRCRCKMSLENRLWLYNPGPIAQRLEQQTHNLLVPGSNPGGPTSSRNSWHLFHSGAAFMIRGMGRLILHVRAATVRSLAPLVKARGFGMTRRK